MWKTIGEVLREALLDEFLKDEIFLNKILGGLADTGLKLIGFDMESTLGISPGDVIEWAVAFGQTAKSISRTIKTQNAITEIMNNLENEPDGGSEVTREQMQQQKERAMAEVNRLCKKLGMLKGHGSFMKKVEIAQKIATTINKYVDVIKINWGPNVDTDSQQSMDQAKDFMKKEFITGAVQSLLDGKTSINTILDNVAAKAQQAGFLEEGAYFYLQVVTLDGNLKTIGKIDTKTDTRQDQDLLDMSIGNFFSQYQFKDFTVVDPKRRDPKTGRYTSNKGRLKNS
ncbi:MAG: hypothetical protein ACTSU9_07805 [Promethearchaeota archaeon]